MFDSLKDDHYDYRACTESIVWLEMHGFDGVHALETVLQRLLDKDHVPTEIVAGDPNSFTINGGGQTLFAIASVAVDLAASMLSRSNPFGVTIKNALNPIAMIPAVHRARRYPGSIGVWWRATEEPTVYLIRGGADSEYPELERFQIDAEDQQFDSAVHLVCCTGTEKLSAHLPDMSALTHLEHVGAAEFAMRYSESVSDGIEINAQSYARICDVAA